MDIFNETDAIFADGLEANIQTYIDRGGKLETAAEALMESYEGHPDMVRALVDWCGLYGDGTASLQSAVEHVLLDNEATVISRLDEALASAEHSLPIITAITSSKRWSPVVTAMSKRNTESTLHNLLMREARLAKFGISHSVYQSPESFVNAIMHQITSLLSDNAAVSGEEFDKLFNRIATMSTYDECSTVFAMRLFNTLSKEAPDPLMRGLYRRMGQEVRKEAVNVMKEASVVSEGGARQFVTRLAVLTDAISSDVVVRKQVIDALVSLLANDRSSRRRYEPETKVLQDCYGRLIGELGIGDGDGEVVESVIELNYQIAEKVVLVRTLCQVEIFEEVIKALFSHEHRTYLDGGKPDHGKRRCLCLLLSYAGVFICVDDRELPEKLLNENSKAELRQSIKAMFQRLDRTAAVCEDLKPGCPRFKIKGKAVEVLLEGVKDPLIARGILMWAKEGLHGGSDLRALMMTAPKHLAFLEAIAENHVIMRGHVLDIIREAFKRDYPGLDITQIEDLRDMLMKTTTDLVRIQMAPQLVEEFRRSWARDTKVDLAHLRRFIGGLLQRISPPYSQLFASSLLELLHESRMERAVDKDARTAELVLNFRQEAGKMGLV